MKPLDACAHGNRRQPWRAALIYCLLLTVGVGPKLAAQQTVTIDPGTRHQTIEGFGTCLISWVPTIQELYENPAFQQRYAKELGLSMLRVELMGATLPDPIENAADIDYRRFAPPGEKGNMQFIFMDFAKALKRINPDTRIIGTVWTPPYWMKFNNARDDQDRHPDDGMIPGDQYMVRGRAITNRLRPEYLPHMVAWLVEMARWHESEGVPLYAMSPGNEVQFTQTFQSCVWTAEDYAQMLVLLRQELDRAGFEDLILFGPETLTTMNWPKANPMYIKALLADPKVRPALDVWATHAYTDGFAVDFQRAPTVELVHRLKPYGIPVWMTESGTGPHEHPEAILKLGGSLHNSLVHGGMSAFVPWQITESHRSGHSLMHGHRLTPKSRVMQHYSRFIRPGAVRIEATPPDGPIFASAYVHDADASMVVVLTNPTDRAQALELRFRGDNIPAKMDPYITDAKRRFEPGLTVTLQDGRLALRMPPQSMATLVGATR